MRTYFYFIVLIFLSSATFAQVPNANFENWNNTTIDQINVWSSQGMVTKDLSGQQGSYAAKLQTSVQGFLNTQAILALAGAFPDGYPYTAKADTIKLWVKYNVVNMDTATIHIEQLNNGNLVRAGVKFITVGNVGNWTEISIPMEIIDTAATPNSILITMNNTSEYTPQMGSFLVVDNIRAYFNNNLLTALPNNSFESWTTQNIKEIAGWTTSNEVISQFGIDSINCEQTTTAQNGTYGVKMRTLDLLGVMIPGGMVTGVHRLDAGQDPATFPTFSVNDRYSSLSGFLKFTKAGTDDAEAAIYMFKDGLLVGQGHYFQKTTVNTYTQFEAKIVYNASFTGIPDSATIIFLTASDPNNATGACVLYVDNIQLNKFALGIHAPLAATTIYPNPFEDHIVVPVSGTKASVQIFSADGREVYSGEITNGYNEINTAAFSSGVYFLKLEDDVQISNIRLLKK